MENLPTGVAKHIYSHIYKEQAIVELRKLKQGEPSIERCINRINMGWKGRTFLDRVPTVQREKRRQFPPPT